MRNIKFIKSNNFIPIEGEELLFGNDATPNTYSLGKYSKGAYYSDISDYEVIPKYILPRNMESKYRAQLSLKSLLKTQSNE